MQELHLLSLVTFHPLAWVVLLFLLDRDNTRVIKGVTLAATLFTLIGAAFLAIYFVPEDSGFQFMEKRSWMDSLGISYTVGVDGISLPLFLLTAFLTPLAVLCSWNAISSNWREYAICLLVLEAAMLGAFVALDLFLFYVFWEGMLIPMYFIIGAWGGQRRLYATMKYLIYTLAGSVLMLIALLALYFYIGQMTGEYTFDALRLAELETPFQLQCFLFAGFAISFLIKVPAFPFHTWLPDAHVEAPTAGSVILAGVLLKMGGYGFIRFCLTLFPSASAAFAPLMIGLALVGIVYGALVAFAQVDIKKLVAYSSVSHMGVVLLGIFSFGKEALNGAIFQMVHHGLATSGLFLIIGILYERRHTRIITDYGGVAVSAPLISSAFMLFTLASIGLPLLSGFPGELLILNGAFGVAPWTAVVAASGVVLSAVYMLQAYQRMMLGPAVNIENAKLVDLSLREVVVILPVVLLIFAVGLYPELILGVTRSAVEAFFSSGPASVLTGGR